MGSGRFMDGYGSNARFATPLGIAVDNSGFVYVVDNVNMKIRRVSTAGYFPFLSISKLEIAINMLSNLLGLTTTLAGSLANFRSVALDSSGNVYAGGDSTILKISASGPIVECYSYSGVINFSIHFHRSSTNLYWRNDSWKR